MMKVTLKQIADITKGDLYGDENIAISDISIDSRTIIPGDHVLFFCIKGERHDGHDYIQRLIERGVSNFIVKRTHAGNNLKASFIAVNDTLEALHKLASWRRNRFKRQIIGITGSNGKTIVKEWLAQCLQSKFKLVRSPKSFNSQVGVPLSLWLLDESSDLAIIEAGISKPAEMERLEHMIQPDIGIITNLGEAHQENFSSLQEKAREKINLFKKCKTIIYCKDYELLDHLIRKKYPEKELISWSRNQESWLPVKVLHKNHQNTILQFAFHTEEHEVKIPFQDAGSVENAIHVLTLLLYFQFSVSEIKRLLASLTPVAMRLEQKRGINNCIIINDTYNSDLHSLTIALDYLEQQSGQLKKSVILSDILQSGRPEAALYQEVANQITKRGVFRFVGIGRALHEHRHLFDNNSQFHLSTSDFLKHFDLEALKDEVILLKGARAFEFENISSRLEEKLHRTEFEINLDAMVHNLNYYRSLVPSTTKMMVMLKAFSYGSGTYEIANVLQHQQVNYFGVAIADEGVDLRRQGIHVPVMVMNPDETSFPLITDFRLEPEIYSFQVLTAFIEHIKRNGLAQYPIHIKIDSGMHRLGFQDEDIPALIDALKNQSGIKVKSVFSHLAASDEPENDNFTNHQVHLYQSISDKLKKSLGYSFMQHILNSAGIERFPAYAMDMVRLGIGLYGSSSHKQKNLLPVGKLQTTIIQIKTIPANETIGYSRKGKFSEPKKIAIVPIGYADGLNRLLSNGNGYMLVKNQLAPIVGNICMDMTMIDITNIDAEVNDEVIIFGEKPTIQELADKTGTIPYEVLTGVSQRVKRVYVRS